MGQEDRNTTDKLDIFDIYNKMERNNILLSFKGVVTSELLASVLQIMENKLDNIEKKPKIRKKVFNVLVECLQNLYHHIDEISSPNISFELDKSAIFIIGKDDGFYSIVTGNYILKENVEGLKERIDEINKMTRDELKVHYQSTLSNGELSSKGGGGLGMIDMARKSGEKLEYDFLPYDQENTFFSLTVKVSQ